MVYYHTSALRSRGKKEKKTEKNRNFGNIGFFVSIHSIETFVTVAIQSVGILNAKHAKITRNIAKLILCCFVLVLSADSTDSTDFVYRNKKSAQSV
jgi:hypothetical protein